MAMANKGPRTVITSRVPNELFKILDDHRRAAGVHALSQFVSDFLAVHAGRPDLARELLPELLPAAQ